MIVRIGGIVNPGQYWIRELTMSRTEGQESKGVNAEIFRFEKGLAARYNVDPKANPENEVTNPRPDMLVAVRPSFKSPHWYRGRIVTVSKAHSHDTMVKVSTFNDLKESDNFMLSTNSCSQIEVLHPADYIVLTYMLLYLKHCQNLTTYWLFFQLHPI